MLTLDLTSRPDLGEGAFSLKSKSGCKHASMQTHTHIDDQAHTHTRLQVVDQFSEQNLAQERGKTQFSSSTV